jgi:hypothetical protein
LFRLEEKYANGTLDMDLALKAFRRLKEEFHQEFTEFELQVLSGSGFGSETSLQTCISKIPL